jgi:N utilization substance protein A
MKGVRIQAVVRELNGEKIDIVHWSPDPEILIKRALAPVTPLLVTVDEEFHRATAIVPDDQIQFAIGRRGQNIRLASQLTTYQIEPIKESEYFTADELWIDEIEGLDDEIKRKLREAGYETAESVLDAGEERLVEIEGLDAETVGRILQTLNTYFEEPEEDPAKQDQVTSSEQGEPDPARDESEHDNSAVSKTQE